RTLAAYMNEAGRLLDAGVSIEVIDRALTDFGFPVGPITLMDEVGLDIAGKVGKVMAESFGERMMPGEGVRRVVEAGRTGRKGRSGFYLYDAAGKKGDVDESAVKLALAGRSEMMRLLPAPDASEVVNRCVLALV